MHYKSMQTNVEIDKGLLDMTVNSDYPGKLKLSIDTDPCGIEPKRLHVYDDDGYGNGVLLVRIDLE